MLPSAVETVVVYAYFKIKTKNNFGLRYSKTKEIMSTESDVQNDDSDNRDGNIDIMTELNDQEEEARSLLPNYLYPLVRFHHEDFYVSHSFDPRLVVQLMAEGFLPIATSGILLPKLHVERCILQLSNLHISKSTRKKAKNFYLTINQCFDRVVAGCHAQHGLNWLYPQIVSAFRQINKRTIETDGQGVEAFIVDSKSNKRCGSTQVRLYSVEVWDAQTGDLVAGELGHSVGGIYTSLTGFSNQDNAGSVQLMALGKLLMQCGFEYWDLGMEMEYKLKLGADLMRRADFVREVHRTRVEKKNTMLQCIGRKNARELIDWDRDSILRSEFACGVSSRTSSTVTEASIHENVTNEIDQTSKPKHRKKRSHDEDEDEA